MSEELKPALSWGDALLKINELSKRISELEAVLKKIAETQHICRELELRKVCVFCEANKALSEGKEGGQV